MGQFVAEQREFGTQCSAYLEKNEVYDLFNTLLRQITADQPADPIAFLKKALAEKPPLHVSIMGPPGVDRRNYCKKVADEFNIAHISSGMLLEESLKKGQLPKDTEAAIKAAMKKGELVEDDVVIPIILSEMTKAKKGYVLDGFPRTRVQAGVLSKKEVGFGLDNILLLMAPDDAIKKGYEAKMVAGESSQSGNLVDQRLQLYHRHVISIADVFKNVIRKVPIDLMIESADNFSLILNNIHMRPSAVAPLRSHRVCLVGPCCSGRTTQAKAIANQFGLVHVELPVLIRKLQEERGQMVEDFPPEYMSDEDLCMIVGRRLNETDCIRKGWILDGFPTTQAQAEFLRQAHLWPSRLIELQVDNATILKRIQTRRVDPVDCKIYYAAPASVAIRQRLVQLPHDSPEKVNERVTTCVSDIHGAKATFGTVTSSIQGGAEFSMVTQQIKQIIQNPLVHEGE
jgi:adenylate kinase